MMKKMFFAVFLVILLTVAGCTNAPKQEDVKESSSTQETLSEDIGGTVTTLSEEETVTTQEIKTADTKPAGGTDLKFQLKGLFSNAAKEYMVAYETTLSGGGQPEYKAQMAYYIKGDSKMRVDTLSADMPGAGESRFYMLDGSFIMCNKQGGEWNCIKMPQQADSSKDPKKQSEDIQNDIDLSEISSQPDRVIAGVTAKCFKMIVTISSEEAKNAGISSLENIYCLSPEGVLLYSDTTTENMHVIQEATSYSNTVADSDLVPPAEPKSLSFSGPDAPSAE
jgi:outer membrane lipoprotein-sorting protein